MVDSLCLLLGDFPQKSVEHCVALKDTLQSLFIDLSSQVPMSLAEVDKGRKRSVRDVARLKAAIRRLLLLTLSVILDLKVCLLDEEADRLSQTEALGADQSATEATLAQGVRGLLRLHGEVDWKQHRLLGSARNTLLEED